MSDRAGLEQFLADIAPFFYKRHITYVDVGAYHGQVFERILRSDLMVTEAHLIEPNEHALRVARQRVAAASFRGRSIDYYPLALGAHPGKVRMHRAASMTRVVGDRFGQHDEEGSCFEAERTTLDALADQFTDRRISLLKIDVEGYELEVLAGATELLRQQNIDVLYIEAGMNPEGTQQCYYRRIEDMLAGHGYRTFGMYEQTNEWLEDSPVLRRVNICFFSERFAQSNPYRLTRELRETNQQLEVLQGEISTLESTIAKQTASLERLRAALARSNASSKERERALNESLRSLEQLYRLEASARQDALSAQADLARLLNSFTYRTAAVLARHARSPRKWLATPLALWQEYAGYRYRKAHKAALGEQAPQSVELSARNAHLFMTLNRNTQSVVVLKEEGAPMSVWVTALPAVLQEPVTLGVTALHTGESSFGSAFGQRQLKRHRDLMVRHIPLEPGVPVRLSEAAIESLTLKLFRAQGPACMVKLELREADNGSRELATRAPKTALDAGVPLPREQKSEGPTLTPAPDAVQFPASALDKKLWGGFASYALPELEQLKRDELALTAEREGAAFSLTCWYFVEEDYSRALDYIEFAKRLYTKPRPRWLLAEAQCLIRLGRFEEARGVVERGAVLKQFDFKILSSTIVRHLESERGAASLEAEAAQLAALNELYVASGLSPIIKKREQDPLCISNITSVVEAKHSDQQLKVSIIIPAHNAAGSIDWVIDCLLRQTWRNAEIIVVDDCSTDGTPEIIAALSARDERVRLIRRERNGGAYAARNAGLAHATGELVTVHDSDDWSHPQRIELQVEALEANPTAVAVKSHWIRVSEDLEIIGPWRPKGTLVDLNFSSLLFRKELIDVLGAWDEVRVSGDAEFYSRIKRVYGEEAVVKLPRDALLALSLARENSLTRSKATHVRSLFYGVRGTYRGAYLNWHSRITGQSSELPFRGSNRQRPFPVPLGNQPGRRGRQKYDVIVISDFAMRGGAFVSTLNYIIGACRAGKTVAVVHWRKYSLNADSALQPRLYQACAEYDIDILTPGDDVEAEVVIFGYPPILQHKIDPMPSITAQHVAVIVNQYASRLTDGQDQQYDPLLVRAHLKSMFGKEGVWIPISNGVKRLMQNDQRYPAPYPTPWYPMIDVEPWCSTPIRWRGAERLAPVVGRHGRDAYTKWPSDPAALAEAYGVNQQWDVRFLGGADHAVAALGCVPDNWNIISYDRMPAEEFLRELDFYVHYPHEKYIEEFGRAVMEAMAVGVPVILPPQFEETFGEAAVYATTDQVPQVLSELWTSEEKYLERAEAGRAFVLAHCTILDFGLRLENLLSAHDEAPDSAEQASSLAAHKERMC